MKAKNYNMFWILTFARRVCKTIFAFMHNLFHDDVIKWKHFPRYWPFVRGNQRSPMNSPHKGHWRGALMFSLICALNKRVSKHSWGWWIETPSRSLRRQCNTSLSRACISTKSNRNGKLQKYLVQFLQQRLPTAMQYHRKNAEQWRLDTN